MVSVGGIILKNNDNWQCIVCVSPIRIRFSIDSNNMPTVGKPTHYIKKLIAE